MEDLAEAFQTKQPLIWSQGEKSKCCQFNFLGEKDIYLFPAASLLLKRHSSSFPEDHWDCLVEGKNTEDKVFNLEPS